jgi:hypothetical protein
MNNNQFSRLLALLERMDKAKISYRLEHSRENALMVVAFAPGEYWEIEFLEEGAIDIERFRSNGKILGESVLEEFFALWSEEKLPQQALSPK